MVTLCGGERDIGVESVPDDAAKLFGPFRLFFPLSVCVDPRRPQNCYVGCSISVQYWDSETDKVRLIAGGNAFGSQDGIGSRAQFSSVTGLVVTNAGDRMYLCDRINNQLRLIDLTTNDVTTIGDRTHFLMNDPFNLVFDRSPTAKPESALWITTDQCVVRFDIKSRSVTQSFGKLSNNKHKLSGVACTLSGHVIVSCVETHSIYVFDPTAPVRKGGFGELKLLAGGGTNLSDKWMDGSGGAVRFNRPCAIAITDCDRSLYIVYTGNARVRQMTLPQRFFV